MGKGVEIMLEVEQIKEAVMNLPLPELTNFRKWDEEFEAQKWDKQIETDIHAGKLANLADEVLKNFDAGLCTEL